VNMGISEALRATVVELLRMAETVNLVSSVKSLLKTLQENGVIYTLQIHSKLIGCHPCNRDGYGINAMDVHELGSDIFAIGFDLDEVRAVCCEVSSTDDECRLWNQTLISHADGLLPPMEFLKFATLWGGHTNQVLRCVDAGVPHADESMTVGGRLNLEKIREKDPVFAAAVQDGIKWMVIPASVLTEFPSMASLVQAAGNASGQVAKGEHEFQVLRKIHNAWWGEHARLASSANPNPRVSFADVKEKVLRSKPPCAASVPSMYSFVLTCGGGKSACFLRETELFVKANAPSNRTTAPDLYDALSVDFKGSEQCIRFRHAVLKLAYTCQFHSYS
jgi:hypothetical protein